jgi:hypothetical protein
LSSSWQNRVIYQNNTGNILIQESSGKPKSFYAYMCKVNKITKAIKMAQFYFPITFLWEQTEPNIREVIP